MTTENARRREGCVAAEDEEGVGRIALRAEWEMLA